MYSITCPCSKGGVTKTFTLLSLAVEFSILSKKKARILIVDCDPSRNAGIAAIDDISRVSYTLLDVFKNKDFDVRKAIYPCSDQFPSIDILYGHKDLVGIESALAQRKNKETILNRALSDIAPDYDFAFIDTPPNDGILTQNAIAACDAYLVPIDHDRNALDGYFGASHIVDDLYDEGSIQTKPKCLGALFVKVATGAKVTKVTNLVDEVAKKEVKNLIPIRIPSSTHAKEAMFYSTTLQFQRKHPVTIEYNKLAKYIIKSSNLKGF